MIELKNRLLVLDDEPNMCLSLRKLLEIEGFEVVTVGTVQEGLELLNSSFFDVVITDLVFPDGSGMEILKYCTEYCRKTKVICMTGRASTDSAIEAIRYGAHDYVTKPFNFDILLHSIKSVFEKISMEEEIDLEKDRYRALIEDLKDGYFVIENRTVVYANKAMASMLGCSINELTGRDMFSLLAPSVTDTVEAGLAPMEKQEAGFWHEELVFLNSAGNEVPVDIKFSRGRSDGNTQTLVCLCREITERDILWERLIKAEKLALMGEMTAGIAHELNNKLTPVLGFIELLRMNTQDAENQNRIEALHSAALGARKIVQSLLAFARREPPRKKVVDMNGLVEAAMSLVKSSFSASEIDVSMELDSASLHVSVDPAQIEQVLTNIFKNAYEAMGKHGTLKVQSRSEGEKVVVTVCDTGPGISEELRGRIFNPFFTTKEFARGTGLGLSICHGIISNHNGEIELIDSEQGAVFRLTLPVAEKVPATTDNASAGSDMPASIVSRRGVNRPAMMVVDDEPAIGRLIKEAFCYRFDVEVVGDGKEALARIQNREFDIVISDIRMPGIDGVELYNILETTFPFYLDRIIYTTGVTFEAATSAFFTRTGVPYLEKPFRVSRLMKMVDAMMQKDHQRQAVA